MKQTRISLEHTGRFNRLLLDFVNDDERLRKFHSHRHALENYATKIENRNNFPLDRELLADSLLAQYESIGGAKGDVKRNIDRLRTENTFTVTTGHQLNIFTGPLYFVYKILHTIKLADQLQEAYPNHHFVPIYWMNSEDHDLEEIGQFNLFGKNYQWETEQTGATGAMNPSSLVPLASELNTVFENDKEALKVVQLFRDAYSKYPDLATSTRYFADQLFAKYGLVIIDSNDANLKASFINHMKRDLLKNEPFHAIRKTNESLVNEDYNVQVNPRQINLFYLDNGIRNRIVATDKGFRVMHTETRFTESEMLTELENHPERFSPNVVLRPLFQEHILPNLTYVGGAGELAYWLQYESYFNEMGVSYPMLSLRNHFLLIDSYSTQKMSELKLLPEDLFHSVDELIKDHVLELSDTEVSLEDELAMLDKLYDSLKQKAAEIDTSLEASIEAEKARISKALEQWEGRFSRALKKENEVSVNRIKKLHKKLFPNGYLQERHDNILAFYSQTSGDFLDKLYENTDPFSTEFTVLNLS